jgi:hypothetical protein
MAVAFNPADSSIGSRQLISELDYLLSTTINDMLTSGELLEPKRAGSWTRIVHFCSFSNPRTIKRRDNFFPSAPDSLI